MALAHAPLAAHDGRHRPDVRQPFPDADTLAADLAAQVGDIRSGDLVVGAELHRSQAARASIQRLITTTTMAVR
jgi:hypothetical protein